MPKRWREEDELHLPIKLDASTNGEYFPLPASDRLRAVTKVAHERAQLHARRLGLSRREFLTSSCGAATVLLALNELSGCGAGGTYNVPKQASTDRAAADASLTGDEFIFDVQTHHVNPQRPWWRSQRPTLKGFLESIPQAKCGKPNALDCFDSEVLFKEVFLDSDTDMAVLSALWGTPDMNPISASEAAQTRDRIAAMQGAPRLLIQGLVYGKATSPAQNNEQMHALVSEIKVDAWKLYPVWSEDGQGYRLDDPATGLRVIEAGLSHGRSIFAIHKGLRLPGMDRAFISALDVGPAAKAFPQAQLVIYHSGFENGNVEGPYNAKAERGVDALIRSAQENGIGQGGNVYAELGSLWREVMKDPDQAAHVMGKLLKHFGEDRILWGTDAIWYGSPQDQIQAFRTFEITPQFQERFGYPALTKTAKAKIFGLNAARLYGLDSEEIRRAQTWDPVSKARSDYQNAPAPSHQTYGPRTRREMLAFLRHERHA